MIPSTREWVMEFIAKYPLPPESIDILDVGSRDINGNLRYLFPGHNYIGLDFLPGGNVDVVMNAHDLDKKYDPESFDIILCLDTLEHDHKFWLTVEQMRKVLKRKGWMIITVPSLNHGFHAQPNDFYRFFDSVFTEIFFKDFEEVNIRVDLYNNNPDKKKPDEILGWGRKP